MNYIYRDSIQVWTKIEKIGSFHNIFVVLERFKSVLGGMRDIALFIIFHEQTQ